MVQAFLNLHDFCGRKVVDGFFGKRVDSLSAFRDLRGIAETAFYNLQFGFAFGSERKAFPAAEVKKFIDESVKYYRKIEGKLVAAFTSTGMIGGGGETVCLDILKAFLILPTQT